jgi:hypothetical protein
MKAGLSGLELTHVQFVLLAGIVWLNQQGESVTKAKLAAHAKTDIMNFVLDNDSDSFSQCRHTWQRKFVQVFILPFSLAFTTPSTFPKEVVANPS